MRALGVANQNTEPAFTFDDIFDSSLRPRYTSAQWFSSLSTSGNPPSPLRCRPPRPPPIHLHFGQNA